MYLDSLQIAFSQSLFPNSLMQNFPSLNMSSRLAKRVFSTCETFKEWDSKDLTEEVPVLPANALVSSRLDYCNSLFRGFSCFNKHKLQTSQNTFTCIVSNHRKYARVTPTLKQLH